MRLIFLGPPGAGKGTVSKHIIEKYGICQISTGDIFRASVKDGSELGNRVKAVIDSGALVPDELTIALVRERLSMKDAESGFILDGFPRTIAQAEALSVFQKIDQVIDFVITDKEALINRLSGRLTCKQCSAIYSAHRNPPKKPGVCDVCRGELYVRKDDEPASIKKRLEVYETETAPLAAYYEKSGLLHKIDAAKDEAGVLSQVERLLKS